MDFFISPENVRITMLDSFLPTRGFKRFSFEEPECGPVFFFVTPSRLEKTTLLVRDRNRVVGYWIKQGFLILVILRRAIRHVGGNPGVSPSLSFQLYPPFPFQVHSPSSVCRSHRLATLEETSFVPVSGSFLALVFPPTESLPNVLRAISAPSPAYFQVLWCLFLLTQSAMPFGVVLHGCHKHSLGR